MHPQIWYWWLDAPRLGHRQRPCLGVGQHVHLNAVERFQSVELLHRLHTLARSDDDTAMYQPFTSEEAWACLAALASEFYIFAA